MIKNKNIIIYRNNVIAQIGSAGSLYIRSADSYQNAKQMINTLDFGPIIASLIRAQIYVAIRDVASDPITKIKLFRKKMLI